MNLGWTSHWNTVTKTRKILQASQVLQRAVVDGSLAEAIFSQVAKLGG